MGVYKDIFNLQGGTVQVDKCIEEMSELIKAFMKNRHEEGGRKKEVIEEIADVLNTIGIICEGWGIREEVREIQGKKIDKFFESLKTT